MPVSDEESQAAANAHKTEMLQRDIEIAVHVGGENGITAQKAREALERHLKRIEK